jgi:hypothetical protein
LVLGVLLSGCDRKARPERFQIDPSKIQSILLRTLRAPESSTPQWSPGLVGQSIDITKYADFLLPLLNGAKPKPGASYVDSVEAEIVLRSSDGMEQVLGIVDVGQNPLSFRYKETMYIRDGKYFPIVVGGRDDVFIAEDYYWIFLAHGTSKQSTRDIEYSLNVLLISSGRMPPSDSMDAIAQMGMPRLHERFREDDVRDEFKLKN